MRESEQVVPGRPADRIDKLVLLERRNISHLDKPASLQFRRRHRSDAPERFYREGVEELQLQTGLDDEQPVGLGNRACNFREELRRCDADAQRQSDLASNPFAQRLRNRAAITNQPPQTGHVDEGLIDREPLNLRRRFPEDLEHRLTGLGIRAHPSGDDDGVGTQALRFANARRTANAPAFGLVTRSGDDAHTHQHRATAQRWIVALLHGRVERIEIGMQDRAYQDRRSSHPRRLHEQTFEQPQPCRYGVARANRRRVASHTATTISGGRPMTSTSHATQSPPLSTGDFDLFADDYVSDPFPFWAEGRGCPVHTSERWGGSHLVIGYDAVVKAAGNVPTLTSTLGTSAAPTLEDRTDPYAPRSIINSDPPNHAPVRRTMLPTFSPGAVAAYEPITRGLCERYLDELGDRTTVDAAVEYAQRIPARVIGLILGVDESMTQEFIGWVRDILERGAENPEGRQKSFETLTEYFAAEVEKRKVEPTDDLITSLLQSRMDNGESVSARDILGNLSLLLLAGIDTTWSAIGSSIWHLAQHRGDRERLRDDPAIWPQAVEELLRAYAPVMMGRIALDETEIAGCPVATGRRVLLSFPAANRDPEMFENPDVVNFDRTENRHLAFGSGIHRCAGSNLARMELRVALQTWMDRFPDFELDSNDTTTWAGGQVRGPRHVPVIVTR